MSRHGRGGAVAVAVILLGACAPLPTVPEAPAVGIPDTAQPTGDRAPCPLRGQTELWAGDALYLDPTSDARIVEFMGSAVDLELHSLPKRGERPAATVRTAGLVLRGYLGAYGFAAFTRRDLSVLGKSIVIAAGTHVVATGASFGALDLEVEYSDFDVRVPGTSCDLVLERLDGPEPRAERAEGRPVHLRRSELELFEHPGDAHPLRLGVARSQPTLYAIEERAGWARVLYVHGPRIDAWVRSDGLEAGSGPDCDHCYGPGVRDAVDRCPEDVGADDDSGCPERTPPLPRVEMSSESPLRLQPSDDAPVVGTAEANAMLAVLERRDAWLRVYAPGWSVMLPSGGGLWLRAP